jgi:deoxyribose-phosphate aldolase
MNNIAEYIDHTFLKIDATNSEIERVCDEAIKYGFKAVCVFPKFLPIVTKKLKDKKPLPITVVDFPLGNKTPSEKRQEAKSAIENGAKELDMVLDVMALKDKNYSLVFDGIKAVVDEAKDLIVKVIIETCYLTDIEIVSACTIAKLAKAKFVKTSTGFAKEGAKVENVILMKKVVGDDMGVKASGGIKTYHMAKMMIEAGATRLGTSSSIQILDKNL